MEGHGLTRSNGGIGANGGSGGRIAIILKTEIYFFGTQQALGGSGLGHYLTAGGPGSVYIQDKRYMYFIYSMFSDLDIIIANSCIHFKCPTDLKQLQNAVQMTVSM